MLQVIDGCWFVRVILVDVRETRDRCQVHLVSPQTKHETEVLHTSK